MQTSLRAKARGEGSLNPEPRQADAWGHLQPNKRSNSHANQSTKQWNNPASRRQPNFLKCAENSINTTELYH